MVKLSAKQKEFQEMALIGHNIFLTGKAGTGKTFIVKDTVKKLKAKNKIVVCIAPTGVAANNLGGQTIHSMFSIRPFGVSDYESCNFIKTEKKRLFRRIDCILIDEISMLRPDVLDAINWTLLKNGCGGLETKQVIFVGDLKQLPSPLDDNTRSILFRKYDGEEFYYAKCYENINPIDIELDEVLRQTNEEFVTHLNVIREGQKSTQYFKKFINSEPKGIILAPHNTTVDKYNQMGYNSVKGQEYIFHAKVEGNVKADEFNLPSVIKVKDGCKIMYLANSKNNDLVNGTLGIFIAKNNKYFIRVGDVDHAIEKIEFSKIEYVINDDQTDLELREIGSIEQYPFKLAYALSIHKSQGLTFEEVTVDLTLPCFAKGQMYVAFSRVTSPDGLRIII